MSPLSPPLLREMRQWETSSISAGTIWYRGSDPQHTRWDPQTWLLYGPAWFTPNLAYASQYAGETNKKFLHSAILWKLETTQDLKLIVRPARLNGEKWPAFIRQCFPNLPINDITTVFRDQLRAHLAALGPLGQCDGASFYGDGEICLLKPEKVTRVVAVRWWDPKTKTRRWYQRLIP